MKKNHDKKKVKGKARITRERVKKVNLGPMKHLEAGCTFAPGFSFNFQKLVSKFYNASFILRN